MLCSSISSGTLGKVISWLIFAVILLGSLSSAALATHPDPASLLRLSKSGSGFVENRGQVRRLCGRQCTEVLYSLHNQGVSMHLQKGGISYVFTDSVLIRRYWSDSSGASAPKVYRLDMRLIGANTNALVIAQDEMSLKHNYYLSQSSNGIEGVKSFKRITYRNIYPGIDWVLYVTGNGQGVKYDFIVHPGADPSIIKIKYAGDQDLDIHRATTGKIHLEHTLGSLQEGKPFVYQQRSQLSHALDTIRSSWTLSGDEASFQIETYDRNQILVIDPIIDWATFIAGTNSSGQGFPGSYHVQEAYDEVTGNPVLWIGITNVEDWTTFLPDSLGITVLDTQVIANKILFYKFEYKVEQGTPYWDLALGVYVGGSTRSSPGIFVPSNILYGLSRGKDNNGGIWALGSTYTSDFPYSGAGIGGFGGDGFLLRINRQGQITYSTPLGVDITSGSIDYDDKSERLWLGITTSGNPELITPNAIHTLPTSPTLYPEGALICLRENAGGGLNLLYGTYLGGSGKDEIGDIGVDSSGNVWVAGRTTSLDLSVPGAIQSQCNECNTLADNSDLFLMKYQPSIDVQNNLQLTQLYGTYFGGSSFEGADEFLPEVPYGISPKVKLSIENQQAGGHVALLSHTFSNDFPLSNSFMGRHNNPERADVSDIVLLVVDSTGTLAMSTVVADNYSNELTPTFVNTLGGMGFDNSGKIWIATSSEDGITVKDDLSEGLYGTFLQPYAGGVSDIGLMALSLKPSVSNPVYFTYLGGSGADQAYDMWHIPDFLHVDIDYYEGIVVGASGALCGDELVTSITPVFPYPEINPGYYVQQLYSRDVQYQSPYDLMGRNLFPYLFKFRQLRSQYEGLDSQIPRFCPQPTTPCSNDSIQITATSTASSCFSCYTGTVSATATGGSSGSYLYTLVNQETGQIYTNQTGKFSNLLGGLYELTAKDRQDTCHNKIFISVFRPDTVTTGCRLTFNSLTVYSASCGVCANGGMNINVSGGSGKYYYTIDKFPSTTVVYEDSTGLVDSLSPGLYRVRVFDLSDTCTIDTLVTIEGEGGCPVALQFNIQQASCSICPDASIIAAATGGSSEYKFLLADYDTFTPLDSNTSGSFNGLIPGRYLLRVNDVQWNCSAALMVQVNGPDSASICQMALTYQIQNASCIDCNDGIVSATVNPRDGFYDFQLEGLNYSSANGTGIFLYVPSGAYVLNVTDLINPACTEQRVINISHAGCDLQLTYQKQNESSPSGQDGSISFQTFSGSGFYDYTINRFSGFASYSSYNTTGVFTGLRDGVYVVTVYDRLTHCYLTDCFEIGQDTCSLQVTFQSQSPSCANCYDGSLQVSVSTVGQGVPHVVLFSSYAQYSAVPYLGQFNFNGLPRGIYTLLVQEGLNGNDGCTEVIPVLLGQEDTTANCELLVAVSAQETTCSNCSDGSLSFNPSNLAISNYSYTISGPSGLFFSNSSGFESFQDLLSGNYTYLVVNNQTLCQQSGLISVPSPHCSMAITSITLPGSCAPCDTFSLEIYVDSTSGNWIDYNLIGNGIHIQSTGYNNIQFSDIPAGDYIITATEQNTGCQAHLDVIVAQDTCNIQYTLDVTKPSGTNAYDGSLTVRLQNMSPSSSYLYSLDKTDFSQSWPPSGAPTFSGISFGTYFLTIEDMVRGCRNVEYVTISRDSCTLFAIVEASKPSCKGCDDGTLHVLTENGQGPYSYTLLGLNYNSQWNYWMKSIDITGLKPGTYLLNIHDESTQCTFSQLIELEEDTCELTMQVDYENDTCVNCAQGSITIHITGQSSSGSNLVRLVGANYDITRNANTVFHFTDLVKGHYVITALNQITGCQSVSTISLSDPGCQLSLTLDSVKNTSCPLCHDGSVWSIATGGSGNYQYILNGKSDIQSSNQGFLGNLSSGSYALIVNDLEFGCSICEHIVIGNDTCSLELSASISRHPSCYQCPNGEMHVSVATPSQGSTHYYYVYGPHYYHLYTTDTLFSNLLPGNYTIRVVELPSLCEDFLSIKIEADSCLLLVNDSVHGLSCPNAADASIHLNVTNYVTPLDIRWSNGSTDSVLTNLTAGVYQVSLADGRNCYFARTYVISDIEVVELDISIPDTAYLICPNNQNDSIVATSSNADAVFKWYASVDGSTPLFTGNPFVPSFQAGGQSTYIYVAAAVGDCESGRKMIRLDISDCCIPQSYDPDIFNCKNCD